VKSSNGYPVHNITTGMDYPTIQAAIDATETSKGDTIIVDEGIYITHVFVTKPLNIMGRNRNTTIIDSGGSSRCFTITANRVNITGFNAKRARWAFYLVGSNESSIYRNKIETSDIGVHLENANNNMIFENLIENINILGEGIYLAQSNNNTIQRNSIVNASCAISLVFSLRNIFRENTLANCSCAFYLQVSSNNSFYHNNIIHNLCNAQTEGLSINSWDYGYPSGGNYWSNYTGVDLYSGSYQNVTGSDGIGDTPYKINATCIDHFPLMKAFAPLVADLNDDSKVDGKDIAVAARAFASHMGSSRWNLLADLNKDNKIDGIDIVTIAKNWKKQQ